MVKQDRWSGYQIFAIEIIKNVVETANKTIAG